MTDLYPITLTKRGDRWQFRSGYRVYETLWTTDAYVVFRDILTRDRYSIIADPVITVRRLFATSTVDFAALEQRLAGTMKVEGRDLYGRHHTG